MVDITIPHLEEKLEADRKARDSEHTITSCYLKMKIEEVQTKALAGDKEARELLKHMDAQDETSLTWTETQIAASRDTAFRLAMGEILQERQLPAEG